MINKVMELLDLLKRDTVTPADVAKKVKESLPPQLLLFVKAETTTPESLLAQIRPVASFLGPEAMKLLESEGTKKIIAETLIVLRKG